MKSFSSVKYRVVGYGEVVINGLNTHCWILETIAIPTKSPFKPTVILVDEAKFYDNGSLIYLNRDGSSRAKECSTSKVRIENV